MLDVILYYSSLPPAASAPLPLQGEQTDTPGTVNEAIREARERQADRKTRATALGKAEGESIPLAVFEEAVRAASASGKGQASVNIRSDAVEAMLTEMEVKAFWEAFAEIVAVRMVTTVISFGCVKPECEIIVTW